MFLPWAKKFFSKVPGENLKESGKVPLPAPVRRLFFVNEHGQDGKLGSPSAEKGAGGFLQAVGFPRGC